MSRKNRVEGAIIAAYGTLKSSDNDWVSLHRLRTHLDWIPRSDLDDALTAMHREQWIRLISEVNQKALTDADRAAALPFGGDHKHLYMVTDHST